MNLPLAALVLLAVASTPALPKPMTAAKPSIVLVHGAFADGSAWSKVIPLLQKDGYTVTAVQDPMTAYADDVATTRRVIEAQPGPVVLVGHSYGGAVISGAATDKVKALVYVAAFGLDEGETAMGLLAKYPTPLGTALVPDSAGFLTIDRAKFHAVFAADLPPSEAGVMAAAQGPIKGDIFGTPMGAPAWKTIPSWCLIAKSDQAIHPDLERFFAKRMNAKTSEVESSHVPFLSKPEVVAKTIEEAAKAVESGS
jgi:pimeloyl-ACP methyl ester carboxylesterase